MTHKPMITAVLGTMLLAAAVFPNPAALAADTLSSQPITTFTLAQKNSTALMVKGYATVPLKDLASSLGWQITLKSNGYYELKKGTKVLTLKSNEAQILQGKQATALPVPVRLVNQRLYVPVRAVTQLLGAETIWESSTKTIKIVAKGNGATAPEVHYAFTKDTEGWTSGFADLPVDHGQADFQLNSGVGVIPLAAGTTTRGFMLSGMNRSDDLFMFLTRTLSSTEGIKPNTNYTVSLSFDMATSEGGEQMGVGGSPAQSVYVKAGIVNTAPKVIANDASSTGTPHLALNLDKGIQSVGGKDLLLLGNVEKPTPESAGYELKHFEQEFSVSSNASGKLYVIIGTDSGYEGLTSLYYTNIDISFH